MALFACMQARSMMKLPDNPTKNDDLIILHQRRRKEKVVVVVGATGTGKSRLSINIATHFGGEVINSDKIQVYEGLDVIANKITDDERISVPHHLLGFVDPDEDFTVEDYVRHASLAAESIALKGRLPVVAGGSVSLVKALVEKHIDACDFCFLWVDVAKHVLNSVLSKRVDIMVERGLVEEARRFYEESGDYSRGLRRAIGVPEMDRFFRNEAGVDDGERAKLLEAAIDEIKANTHKLASNQVAKILRLPEELGVHLRRLDATSVFQAHGVSAAEVEWQKVVWEPSARVLSDFLHDKSEVKERRQTKMRIDK